MTKQEHETTRTNTTQYLRNHRFTVQYLRNHSLYLNVSSMLVPCRKDTTFPPLLNVSVPTISIRPVAISLRIAPVEGDSSGGVWSGETSKSCKFGFVISSCDDSVVEREREWVLSRMWSRCRHSILCKILVLSVVQCFLEAMYHLFGNLWALLVDQQRTSSV